MRRATWGVMFLAIAVTTAAVLFQYNSSLAQAPSVRTGPISPSGELIALSHELGEGRQQVTLIDPQARVMAVYQIDRSSGQITLKSVRNVHWDLQMEEFNGNSPSPRDLRALLDGR